MREVIFMIHAIDESDKKAADSFEAMLLQGKTDKKLKRRPNKEQK